MALSNEQKASLDAAARPLIEWLNNNLHPHAEVIVRTNGYEVMEGLHNSGLIMDYVKD